MKNSYLILFLFTFTNFCQAAPTDTEALFDAILIPSISDPNFDLWFFTPPNTGPYIPKAKKVYQYQTFTLLMLARVDPVGSQNRLEIDYDLKITSPNKTPIIERKNICFYKGEAEIKGLLLPKDVLGIKFDGKECVGTYHIEAIFREKVSNRSFTATTEIELVPFKCPKPFTSQEEYSEWVMNYYHAPDPVRSFAAVLYYVQTDSKWIERNYSSLAFHRCIFQDKPFLWKYYTQMYQGAPEDEKKKMLLIAAVIPSKEKDKLFVPNIEPALKPFYQKFSKIRIPDTNKEITSAVQLDILWSDFFASGRYKPIRQLVGALALKKYEGTLEKIKNDEIKELTDEIEKLAMLDATYQSVVWSLYSNCMQHHLVHQYCQTIYEHESLSPDVKKTLGTVLAMVDIQKQKENGKAE